MLWGAVKRKHQIAIIFRSLGHPRQVVVELVEAVCDFAQRYLCRNVRRASSCWHIAPVGQKIWKGVVLEQRLEHLVFVQSTPVVRFVTSRPPPPLQLHDTPRSRLEDAELVVRRDIDHGRHPLKVQLA